MAAQQHKPGKQDHRADPVPPEGHAGPPPDEMVSPPKFGTAKPAEAAAPLPRIVEELERAPAGVKRFKIRCDNYPPQPRHYILARSEDEAKACYMKNSTLEQEMERIKKGGAVPDQPVLVVTALPD